MASEFSEERREKVSGSQYALLRDLADEAALKAASLGGAVGGSLPIGFRWPGRSLVRMRGDHERLGRQIESSMPRTRNRLDEERILEVDVDRIRGHIERDHLMLDPGHLGLSASK
jgi:hypothetical protein